jgi:hypothetical protein
VVRQPTEYGALLLGELGAGGRDKRLLKPAELAVVAAHGLLQRVAAFEEFVVLDAWVGFAEYSYLYLQVSDVFEDFAVLGGRIRVGSRPGGNIHLSINSPRQDSLLGTRFKRFSLEAASTGDGVAWDRLFLGVVCYMLLVICEKNLARVLTGYMMLTFLGCVFVFGGLHFCI